MKKFLLPFLNMVRVISRIHRWLGKCKFEEVASRREVELSFL